MTFLLYQSASSNIRRLSIDYASFSQPSIPVRLLHQEAGRAAQGGAGVGDGGRRVWRGGASDIDEEEFLFDRLQTNAQTCTY